MVSLGLEKGDGAWLFETFALGSLNAYIININETK